jgi:phage-related protein
MMKPVVWRGDSLARLREFPREAMREAGYQLERLQTGREAKDWKPMPSIGTGVNELRVRMGGAFRVVYVANLRKRSMCCMRFRRSRNAPRAWMWNSRAPDSKV